MVPVARRKLDMNETSDMNERSGSIKDAVPFLERTLWFFMSPSWAGHILNSNGTQKQNSAW